MTIRQKLKNVDWKHIIKLILFVTLILSIAYSIVQIILAPNIQQEAKTFERLKSDYVLMLLQCVLGLVVMMIPDFLERKWLLEIPNGMTIMYFIFLYCAIYLGEVRNFFFVIPYWDTVLHAFSGAMLGALGFSLVSILNESKKVALELSPFFVALFAFCFALSMGALWEIYEYLADGLLGLNMQKFRLGKRDGAHRACCACRYDGGFYHRCAERLGHG